MDEGLEQLCQRIMDSRGYLVVETRRTLPLGVCDEPLNGNGKYGLLRHRTVITMETTAEDWLAQHSIIGENYPPLWYLEDKHFYRVIAE